MKNIFVLRFNWNSEWLSSAKDEIIEKYFKKRGGYVQGRCHIICARYDCKWPHTKLKVHVKKFVWINKLDLRLDWGDSVIGYSFPMIIEYALLAKCITKQHRKWD